jgi:hypothetical protein
MRGIGELATTVTEQKHGNGHAGIVEHKEGGRKSVEVQYWYRFGTGSPLSNASGAEG